MVPKKGPAADDDGRRGDFFAFGNTNSPPNNQPAQPGQEPIRAELSGSTLAAGIKVDSGSPVLAMCRKLIAAGHNPAAALHAYRDDTLCLTVHSIGEGAALEINGAGTGFRRRYGLGSASPVRFDVTDGGGDAE